MADVANARWLPGIGTFSYNGFAFGQYTQSTCDVNPVPGEDQRNVKWNEVTFTVSGYATVDNDGDDDDVDLTDLLTTMRQ